MIKWLIPMVLSFACAACAPVPRHLYVADVPKQSLVYAYCPMNKHVPVGALFAVDGVHATVGLFRAGDRDYVEVQLDVPEGKTMVFQSDVLRLTRGSVTQDNTIPNISTSDYRIEYHYRANAGLLPTTTPMVGERIVSGSLTFDKHYWLDTYVDTAAADDVWITLPPFSINGAPQRLEPIHFKRQVIVIIAMINC